MTPDQTYAERVAAVDETIARLEAQLAGAREFREDLAAQAVHEVTEGLAKNGVRRSELTALQKHQLIRRLGQAEYMRLPW
jgi:hypothetical protein